jgi:hypothetical protein
MSENYNYVVLAETSGCWLETWYNFIRYEGNEENLKHLQDQLEQIDMYIIDDLSTFDLDLEHFVSEETANQMIKIEINSRSFHRKFDGTLRKINLKISKSKDNDKLILNLNNKLAMGQIDDYIDGEFIHPEDILSGSEDEDDSEDEDSDFEDDDEDEDEDKDEEVEVEEEEEEAEEEEKHLQDQLEKIDLEGKREEETEESTRDRRRRRRRKALVTQ